MVIVERRRKGRDFVGRCLVFNNGVPFIGEKVYGFVTWVGLGGVGLRHYGFVSWIGWGRIKTFFEL